MSKHATTMTVDTEDNKALRLILNVSKGTVRKKGEKDNGMAMFMRPIRKQLTDLQKRMQRALLDMDTAIGKGKESWE